MSTWWERTTLQELDLLSVKEEEAGDEEKKEGASFRVKMELSQQPDAASSEAQG